MATPMSDEALVTAARSAARSARRASAMTLLAVFVALAVLALDNGIKRAILAEAARARAILDEFKATALEALGDGQAGQAAAGSGATGHSGDAVVHPAGPPPAVAHHAGRAVRAAGPAAGGAAAGP